MKGLFISTALLTLVASPAMANESTAINRSGVRTEWEGGNSRTVVNTTVHRDGYYSGQSSTKAIKLDISTPKAGDFKFSVNGQSAGVWSHAGDSAFLYSTSQSNEQYGYHESLTQNARTVSNSHYENDYAGYEIEATTSAY